MKEKLKQGIQTFGRSLLLPIGVMAPIGMLMGITGALTQVYLIERLPFLGNGVLQAIFESLKNISTVIFNNIPILFAMGVAYGLSKKEKGIAVFSAVLGYLTLLATMNVYLTLTGSLDSDNMSLAGQGMVLGIHTLRIDAIGGIISGIVAARVADKYYKLELPLIFAFFGGKKSVPIITFAYMIPIGFIIPFIWGYLTKFLISISFIFMNKYYGIGVYWFLNRALIPFGLHHVLASIVRFTPAGGVYTIDGETYTGVLNATNKILFELGPNHESWKRLMPTLTPYLGGGQMINTMFRIPAIGLAMYNTAYKVNKKIAKGAILTIVLTAFLGNVTEPVEFSFLFLSPLLFIVYSLLCGIMSIPLAFLNIGIGYIRGTIFDFAIFGLLYEHTGWINLILLGIINFVVFYFVFKFFIIRLNLVTPGREEGVKNSDLLKNKKYDEIADMLARALGGKENITHVENCITRLRIDLKDPDIVDQELIKKAGASGMFFPQKNHIHIVYGPHVEFVRNALDDKIN